MKTRRQTVSENRLTTKRSRISENGRDNSLPIPIDLIVEIFSRLPAKSIARCRCVSRLWASTLRRPDFTELFLTRSLARPQLLFTYRRLGEVFFFSSPQPQNPDENSSPVVANYHMKFPFAAWFEMSGLVHGLALLTETQRISKGRNETGPVIFNPSTGQSLVLPRVKTKRVKVESYLGYDPIEKQFKVLSMTMPMPIIGKASVCGEHQILTLGTRKLSWRMIECCIPHDLPHGNICINGVLYYLATNRSLGVDLIVCFDVRSENFTSITVVEAAIKAVSDGTMINHNGKLGLLVYELCWGNHGNDRNIELWVLEDAEKQEWSKRTYRYPALWYNIVGNTRLFFVGLTRTNEIVLSPMRHTGSFYLVYYNIERNMIVRVGIHGVEAAYNCMVYIYLDHVENVNLLQVF